MSPPSQADLEAHYRELLAKDLLKRGYRVQGRARNLLQGAAGHPRRVDTGDLLSSVAVQLTTYGGEPAVRIGTNRRHATFVHSGTGLYGPRHRPITPRRGRVLAFRVHGRTVFARHVRGMRPNAFLKDALPAARG